MLQTHDNESANRKLKIENETNWQKNTVIRWTKFLVTLFLQSQLICIFTSMDSTPENDSLSRKTRYWRDTNEILICNEQIKWEDIFKTTLDKSPLYTNFFFAKLNLCHFIVLKTCEKNPASFVHDRAYKMAGFVRKRKKKCVSNSEKKFRAYGHFKQIQCSNYLWF